MGLLAWIILFTLIGGALSVVAASLYLILPGHWRERSIPHLVSYAIGALLGAAFLALLPHALAEPTLDPHLIMLAVLLGIFGFFLLERMVIWRHCHKHECEVHLPHAHSHDEQKKKSNTLVILIGDGLHNLVDGVLIGAAFLTDIHLGIVTALAVAAHEIPQELGDFAILLNNGLSRGKAFLYNVLSSLTTVIGGLLAYFLLAEASKIVPFVLAVAASSFIYIAVADLLPGLNKRLHPRDTLAQIILIFAGVSTIYLAHSTLH